MPDVREVYEMVTKQKSPEPGVLERQRTRQVRTARNRKIGSFAIVALMIVVGATVYTVTRDDAANDGLADRPTPPPARPTQAHVFVDLETGEATPLPTSLAGGYAYPRSPDGALFAYGPWPAPIGDDPRLSLFVAGLDGTDARTVEAIDDLDAIGPSWSPDGNTLVFQLRDDRGEQVGSLMTVDLASGRTREVLGPVDTSSPHWFTSPSFSPDGERIMFNLPRGAYPIPRTTDPDQERWDLWSISTDPSSLFGPRLVRKNAAHGSFSPDGTTIVYLDRPTFAGATFGARRLWLMDANGADPRPLVEGDFVSWPRWSPDGSRIAYEDSRQIFVVDVATGERVDIAAGTAPEWFDDETLIVGPT